MPAQVPFVSSAGAGFLLHDQAQCMFYYNSCKTGVDPMEALTYCDDDEQPGGEVCCVGQIPHLLPYQDNCKQAPQKPGAPASHCIQTQASGLRYRHMSLQKK